MQRKIVTLFSIFLILFSALNPLYLFASETKPALEDINASLSVDSGTSDYITWQVLVKFKESKIDLDKSSSKTKLLNFEKSKKLDNLDVIKEKNIVVMDIESNKSVETTVAELEKDSNVEYVQPNFIYYPTRSNPDDMYFGNQWALRNLGQSVNGVTWTSGADTKWNFAMDIFSWVSSGTWSVVAVLDDWVAYNHLDLANKMWDWTNCKDYQWNALWNCNHGYDINGMDTTPLPTAGNTHWTFVAWIIWAQADNAIWIAWINPNVKIMAVKIGDNSFSTADAVKWISFAKYNGAKIINASWWSNWLDTGTNLAINEDYLLYQAIADFGNAGWLFVTAAWNDW